MGVERGEVTNRKDGFPGENEKGERIWQEHIQADMQVKFLDYCPNI